MGVEQLVALSAVAVLGFAGLASLGVGLGHAIDDGVHSASRIAPAPMALSQQAGTVGALERLAERAHPGEALADAARQAGRAAETAGDARPFIADLRPAAQALFGDRATRPVVKQWTALLADVDESHAVIVTELASAVSALLESDHLSQLFANATAIHSDAPPRFATLVQDTVRSGLARILDPFDSRKRERLLSSLLQELDGRSFAEISFESRLELASRPSTAPEFLAAAALDAMLDIRRTAARNPKTPVPTLLRLLDDQSAGVRAAVAANPSLPEPVLLGLADDADWYVRQAVAGNPSASEAALTRLVDTGDKYQRGNVAENPATPRPLLDRLLKDPELHERLLTNPALPEAFLTTLSTSANYKVRVLVAENLETPTSILETLASDSHDHVRFAVAENVSTPKATLRDLLEDSDEAVVLAAEETLAWKPTAPVTRTVPTHDALWEETNAITSAITRVLFSLDHGFDIRPSSTRAWSDLPSITPQELRTLRVSEQVERIDGTQFKAAGAEYRIKVLRSDAQLSANGEYMGNCTGDYCDRVEASETIVVAIANVREPQKTLYNVAWDLNGAGTWSLSEKKARFNQEIESTAVRQAIDRLTDRLNAKR